MPSRLSARLPAHERNEMEELIDIYNGRRERTGRTLPRGTRLGEDEFMLYALVLVQDSAGRFLITQRALDKHWGAGWWEVPGGGVPAGEDTRDTAVRELAEEVGLDAKGQVGEPIYSYRNVDLARGDNYIVDIFLVQLDFDATDVRLQTEEAIDFRLASWEEISELAAQGIFLHYRRLCEALGR
jgi:8-oxo-dGTP pyrophosphatase MutT (NUDIX family)